MLGRWWRALWAVYRRWQDIRQAAFDLKVARSEYRRKGYHVHSAVAVPLCAEVVFHERGCRCGGMVPTTCGNRMTTRRFLWMGRCADCSTKQKAAKRR